jgi:hypothetical protein
MSDEEIVKLDIKSQYPNMTDEEVDDLINERKDKGVLNKMAESAREKLTQAEQQRTEYEQQMAQKQYEQDVNAVGQILQNTNTVYGVPLTEDIKKDVFVAATQRDDEGLTYLDRALQSNEGVILATLGLLHMEDLMKANASVNTNRRSKKLVEKLFENPQDLQSNSSDNLDTPKFDPSAANSF